MRATAEKPTTPGTAEKAGNLVTVRTSGAKGTPAAAEMSATLGSQSIAGTQEIAITQATIATPKAAEMPNTVPTPTNREFSHKFAINSPENSWKKTKNQNKNCPFLSD
jgi:hypothetical protein